MLDRSPDSNRLPTRRRRSFDSASSAAWEGSSLAPDIIADTFGSSDCYPRLHVLDSTSPQQIKELEERSISRRASSSYPARAARRPSQTRFYAYFHEKISKHVGAAVAGRNFLAITDPGTTLDKEAKEESFRADFENDPNIGGRYSALSFVGIAPSGIAGYDINLLLDRALGAPHANAAASNLIRLSGPRQPRRRHARPAAGPDAVHGIPMSSRAANPPVSS